MDIKYSCKDVEQMIYQNAEEKVCGSALCRSHRPVLHIFSIGSDPASEIYVRNKIRAITRMNLGVVHHLLPSNSYTSEILKEIDRVPLKDGFILVQSPINSCCSDVEEIEITESIPKNKDIDGVTTYSQGLLSDPATENKGFIPCTAKGIITFLELNKIALEGKVVTIINRSSLVGKPLYHLLLNRNATVTMCHSKTPKEVLKDMTLKSDIVITAVGIKDFITPDMISSDTLVIDVGINRDENNKLCGDVAKNAEFADDVYITPVPGGVGLLTVASLVDSIASHR